MVDVSRLSDEEIIRHLPDEVLLQHIRGNKSSPTYQPSVLPEPTVGLAGRVPLSAYQRGERNIIGNLLERPAAATRGFIQGLAPGGFNPIEGYIRGAVNPAATPTFQQQAIEGYYQDIARRQPGQDPNFAQRLGGLVPSAVGLAADVVTNPADLLAILVGKLPGTQQAVGAIAASKPGQAVGRVLTKRRHLPDIPDFLRGNTKKIAEAEQHLERAAHRTVQSFRPKGQLHNRVMQTISQESSKAWAPMQQVARAIPGDIPTQELRAVATTRFANNPERLQALNLLFDEVETTGTSFTAPELVDLSTQVGKLMKRGSVKGTAARTFADMVYSDARTVIGDVLDQRAPLQLKGAVQLAKEQWAAYATDRDALFRTFSLGAPQNAPTARGVALLKRLATGNASPYEEELAARIYGTSGIDLPETIKPFAEALLKARQGGARGKTISKILPWLTGAGLASEAIRRVRGD